MNEKTTEQVYDRDKASKAQREYCESNKCPRFAPSDGWCWRCHRNIYDKLEHPTLNGKSYYTGITVESAGNHLVTGCPHCNRSYCD